MLDTLAPAPGPRGPGPPPEAVALKKSCDAKVAADCYKLAGFHKRGEGGAARDLEKAADFLKKACELNLAARLPGLRGRVAHRRGRQARPAQGRAALPEGLRRRRAEACAELASMCFAARRSRGTSGTRPSSTGRACDAGIAASCAAARGDVRRGLADAEGPGEGGGPLRQGLHGRRRASCGRLAGDAARRARRAARHGEGRGARAQELRRRARRRRASGWRSRCRTARAARRPEAGARALHQGPATAASRAAAWAAASGCATARASRATCRGRSSCFKKACDGTRRRRLLRAGAAARARAGRARPTWPRRRRCCARPARTATRAAASRSASSSRPGRGIVRDLNQAARLFDEACQKGSLPGCSAHAAMLDAGDIIGRDLPRARVLYEKTCAGGIAADCYTLGRLVQKDPNGRKAAFDLFSKGCTGNVPPPATRSPRPGTPAASR